MLDLVQASLHPELRIMPDPPPASRHLEVQEGSRPAPEVLQITPQAQDFSGKAFRLLLPAPDQDPQELPAGRLPSETWRNLLEPH